jgi:DNA replication protein DnaC
MHASERNAGDLVRALSANLGFSEAPITRPCEKCRKDYEPPYPASRLSAACQAIQDQEQKQLERERWVANRRDAWRRLIPPEYAKTDRIRLPKPELFDEVMRWEYDAKGLLIHGDTGLGKSRSAWKLCEREFLAGRSVAAINDRYCLGIPHLYMKDTAWEESERLVEAQIVLFDDVFKAEFSPRMEEFLSTLIEERTAHERPCILTANDTGKTLMARLSPDRGAPLVRRLREFCTLIQFK